VRQRRPSTYVSGSTGGPRPRDGDRKPGAGWYGFARARAVPGQNGPRFVSVPDVHADEPVRQHRGRKPPPSVWQHILIDIGSGRYAVLGTSSREALGSARESACGSASRSPPSGTRETRWCRTCTSKCRDSPDFVSRSVRFDRLPQRRPHQGRKGVDVAEADLRRGDHIRRLGIDDVSNKHVQQTERHQKEHSQGEAEGLDPAPGSSG
jgi:hypothetical protein